MRFDIITIFPSIFKSYLKESLIRRALEKGSIEVNIHNLRKWADDKHGSVDDKPFGGENGMVMMAEPISRAVKNIRKGEDSMVILFTPRGKKFNQQKATEFSNYKQIIMICGRYEGVDERVAKYVANENISIGNYVLMGGELPAMVVLETASRLVPNVIGKESFLKNRKVGESFIEYPQYTRPEKIEIEGKERKVPNILLSGNHKEIKKWRDKKGKIIR